MQSIILTLVLLANVSALPQAPDHVRLYDRGLAEYQSGNFTRAEMLLLEAVDAAKQVNDDYTVALSYCGLGDVYQATERFREAEQSFRKGISSLADKRGRQHAQAIIWRNLAAALAGQTHFADALSALKESSKLAKSNNLQDAVLDAQILNTYGVIYFYQHKIGKAKSSFLRAIEITKRAGTDEELVRRETLHNLGRLYHDAREYEKAEDAYKQSLSIAETRYGASNAMLTVTINNIGSLYNESRRYADAEKQFLRSLAMLQQPQSPFEERQLIETLFGLGKTYILQKEPARASPLLNRAAEFARRTLGNRLEAPQIVEILETYSKVLKDLQNPVEAERIQVEARRIRASAAFTIRATTGK